MTFRIVKATHPLNATKFYVEKKTWLGWSREEDWIVYTDGISGSCPLSFTSEEAAEGYILRVYGKSLETIVKELKI